MSGNRAGGLKAAAKNLAKDPNFYSRIGSKGGRAGNTGGFAADVLCNCELIPMTHFIRRCAGKRGGHKSTRKGIRSGEGKRRTYAPREA